MWGKQRIVPEVEEGAGAVEEEFEEGGAVVGSLISLVRVLMVAVSELRCMPGEKILRIDFAMPTESM